MFLDLVVLVFGSLLGYGLHFFLLAEQGLLRVLVPRLVESIRGVVPVEDGGDQNGHQGDYDPGEKWFHHQNNSSRRQLPRLNEIPVLSWDYLSRYNSLSLQNPT